MAADASSLHCPDCGAPARPEASRCQYCQARLATISCPSCFALMFDGTLFCPKCGAGRARAEEDTAAAPCPGCKRRMTLLRIGDTPVLECAGCDGVWVDGATFEAICADREARAAVLHTFGATTVVKASGVKYRPCVRCGKMMNRVNFGRISGVVVDVCKGHGTFLDPGELHAIVQFIHAGGLERARSRQLEELKEQERKLQDAERRHARDRGKAEPRASIAGWDTWTFMAGGD